MQQFLINIINIESVAKVKDDVDEKLNFLQRYFSNINWDKLISNIITKTISISLLILLFIIIFKIGRKFISRLYTSYAKRTSNNNNRIATIKKMIDSVFYYSIFFIAIFSILSILGIPIGSLIAGAGIIGLALGLGAQGFMNDLITGFFIILEQQINVGDNIKLQNLNIEGIAIAVGIRTTKVKSNEGFIHFIPNRNITTITNLSRSDITVMIDLRINPEEGIEEITRIIKETTKKLAQTYQSLITDTPEVFGLVDLGNGNFAIRTSFSAVNGEQFNLKQAFIAEYVKNLTKNNFTIPSGEVSLK